MKVFVHESLMKSFRKRALKAFPRETLEVVWGKIVNGHVHIFHFEDIDHWGKRTKVEYYPEDITQQHDDAEDVQMVVVGTIHTHPNVKDASPSEEDWDLACQGQEHIHGILSIWKTKSGKFRSKTRWWQTTGVVETIVNGRKVSGRRG